jgi:predicted O-methyltransferase YrrM
LSIDFTSVSDKYAFNGQTQRRKLVERLFQSCHFELFIETGTFIGLTSSYVARKFPVINIITCELNPWNYRIAHNNLSHLPNIEIKLDNSVQTIANYISGRDCKKITFFYLDAHWGIDNPLKKELDLIFTHFDKYVILIDDFEVKGQPDYGWDKGFTSEDDNRFENIRSLVQKFDAAVFFPSVLPRLEAGARRGSIILCSQNLTHELNNMKDFIKKF